MQHARTSKTPAYESAESDARHKQPRRHWPTPTINTGHLNNRRSIATNRDAGSIVRLSSQPGRTRRDYLWPHSSNARSFINVGLTMQRTIAELLDALKSADLRTAARAGFELISRHDECHPHIDTLIDCLGLENYAIAEFARVTIDRTGGYCVAPLRARLERASGRLRCIYLGLIASNGDIDTFMDTFPREFECGDLATRFFAASCIIYRLFSEKERLPEVDSLLHR